MKNTPQFDEGVLELLACPACAGDLQFDISHVVCSNCRRAYPIIDGIPVLIAERAESTNLKS